MLGPDADDTRVNLIRLACTNVAHNWFQHHVERSPQRPKGWNTLEVIQRLQRRFITPCSAAEAAQEFCLLAQGTMAVVELYQELCTLAVQLPSEPDAYTFWQRYMEALHPRIAQQVMGLGYSAECTKIDVLVKVAKAQEAELASQRHFDQTKSSGSSLKKHESSRTAAASAAVVTLAKATPAKSSTWRVRNMPGDSSRRDTCCYNCNKVRHIALACPTTHNTVAGKSAVVINNRSDNKEPATLTSAWANPVSDDQEEDTPAQAEASSKLEMSNNLLWERFENAFSVGSRTCTTVPLGDEVKYTRYQSLRLKLDPEAVLVHTPASCCRQAPAGSGQPVRVPEDQQPIMGYYRVGGVLAHVMFDSGFGTNMVSLEFVRATWLKPVELDNPVGLQMALIGSRGQINFGLNTQLKKYLDAEWWFEGVTEDVASMLCLFKKDKQTLRTVIGLCKRNKNMVKDLTLFPDQDEIREPVTRGRYCLKLNMTSAYEQVRVVPEHIEQTAFQTVYGTYYSNVMHS
ncbi:hypothetical protein FRC09_016351, partial [Ceratobasidium sp. 395]